MKKMSTLGIIGLIILGVLVIFGFLAVGSYNNLVSLKESVDSQYSNIDVQLQRRSDLIPNLVNTVKGYTSHEADVLNQLSESRAKLSGAGSIQDKAEADAQLSSGLSKLLVIVENYPALKADTQFVALMDNLEGTENRISTARKDYNTAVQNYNQVVKSFPAVIVASMFGFTAAERFEAADSAKSVPQVNFSAS